MERVYQELELSPDKTAISSETIRVINSSLYDTSALKTLTYISRASFQEVASDLRSLLALDLNFPLLPQARIAPLLIRHSSKRNMPIAVHYGEGRVTVSADAAQTIQAANFVRVELVPCVLEPSGQERYELVVFGMGNVEASDWEIGAYHVERFKEESTPLAYARCPECNMIPMRAKLQGSNFKVTSQYDLFRLRDFGGIYASPRAKEVLTEICDVGLKFDPV